MQYLPARQRAALLLCDVLGCSAKETARILDTSTASVTSALQRARATLAAKLPPDARDHRSTLSSADEAALVARYVRAWHAADVDALVALMRADIEMAMPPTPSWYRSRDHIGLWTDNRYCVISVLLLTGRELPPSPNYEPAPPRLTRHRDQRARPATPG